MKPTATTSRAVRPLIPVALAAALALSACSAGAPRRSPASATSATGATGAAVTATTTAAATTARPPRPGRVHVRRCARRTAERRHSGQLRLVERGDRTGRLLAEQRHGGAGPTRPSPPRWPTSRECSSPGPAS